MTRPAWKPSIELEREERAMNLKEAQVLGILALIAVGIILLCMWGGKGASKEQAAAPAETVTASEPAAEPSVTELCEHLLKDEAAPAARPAEAARPATVEIGGQQPAASGVGEERTLRAVMDRVAPEDVPLTPAKAAAPQEPKAQLAQASTGLVHIVQPGDTFSSISKKYYGTSGKWRVILDANKKLIDDPRRLHAGMKLTIPAASSLGNSSIAAAAPARPALEANAAVNPAPAAPRTYVVQKADSPWRIAQKVYGDGNRWKDIMAANQDLGIKEPTDLKPGMTLKIP
jgi:nucleoid-associated protein YgaU